MKVAIITDTHYGCRKSSQSFHDYFEKFYGEVFLPYIDENNITTVFHLGDVFDNRKSIDFWALDWAKRVVFDPLKERNIDVYMIVGNHDVVYRNTNKINSVETLLREYDNIFPMSSTQEVVVNGRKIVFCPWINSENKDESFGIIQSSDAEIAMGHFDLNGFLPYPGHIQKNGMDPTIFDQYKKVFSGHFHTRSDNGKIFYLGNPYEIYWNDVGDPRGFTIFDTDTLDHYHVDNPFKMFSKIYYDDIDNSDFPFSDYENKIVKVIVNKRSSIKDFEYFIDNLYRHKVQSIKIIETLDLSSDMEVDESIEESKDTLSILGEYVDSVEIEINKSKIKTMIQDIYKSAFEVI